MLKILAALALVTATNLHGSILPVFTPFCQTTPMRSSTPLTPLGMRVKSSRPAAFWEEVKVQWSDPVVWSSPLASRSMR
uniref:Putative secreted protein n=1 Tax=Ixodes ricinus TaxID=34613 RepID=A0A6B0U432_IXORI